MKTAVFLSVALWIGTATAFAGEVKPLMVERGALILDEAFSARLDTNKWTIAIGSWQIENGTLAGAELAKDHHAAVIRTPFTNLAAVVQFSFMLKGPASGFSFSINDPGGHNSRVIVRADSLTMRKDLDKKDPRSFSPILDEAGASLKPDAWHTMIVELSGEEMLARVDDALFLCGSHPGIHTPKRDFAFPVSGAVLFDDVKVWNATPSPSWPDEKRKLLARQASRPVIDRSNNPAEAYQVAEVKARDRLMKTDAQFKSLVEARAAIAEAIAKAYPVVKRKGPKADDEKKRLAREDAPYKKLTAELRQAQARERDYLFGRDPEAKRCFEAFVAANKGKAKGSAAGKK